MKETKLIIDNSALLVYCGIDGEDSREAIVKYFNEADSILAPGLITYEFVNQIRKFSNEIQYLCIEIFDNLSIELFENISKANLLTVCKKYRLTGYDAAYIELLNNCDERTTFLTFDKDFLNIKDSRIVVKQF